MEKLIILNYNGHVQLIVINIIIQLQIIIILTTTQGQDLSVQQQINTTQLIKPTQVLC